MESIKLVTTTGDIVTHLQSIAEEYNNYFVNVGKSMADSIESDKLSNALNPNVNSTKSSFFVSLCTSQQVYDLRTKKQQKV